MGVSLCALRCAHASKDTPKNSINHTLNLLLQKYIKTHSSVCIYI
ncbi:MAG: hypothetical protein NZ455_06425 [Bacteroidia bacterium]|nr:hypothetical protein [Bacteroidia bacterium]MDW8347775.1 hypothetical protein [Bacteroidia bacterium]